MVWKLCRVGADQGPGESHEQSCTHTLIDHIRHHDPDAPIGQGDEVIEISRGFPGWFPGGRDLPARKYLAAAQGAGWPAHVRRGLIPGDVS